MTDRDVNTMTVDEVRDEVAAREGWVFETANWRTGIWKPKGWPDTRVPICSDHPIHSTLDEASRLPTGWIVSVDQFPDYWRANCVHIHHNTHMTDGNTEMEARFRLRLLCLRTTPSSAGGKRA